MFHSYRHSPAGMCKHKSPENYLANLELKKCKCKIQRVWNQVKLFKFLPPLIPFSNLLINGLCTFGFAASTQLSDRWLKSYFTLLEENRVSLVSGYPNNWDQKFFMKNKCCYYAITLCNEQKYS